MRKIDDSQRGARFTITLDYSDCDERCTTSPPPNIFHVFDSSASIKFRWKAKRDRQSKKMPFNNDVMTAICRKLSWFNNGSGTSRLVTIEGFTELRLHTVDFDTSRSIVRAHPDYRGAGPWMDWVNVCWEHVNETCQPMSVGEVILPARVALFLDFDTAQYVDIPADVLSQFGNSANVLEQRVHDSRQGVQIMIHSACIPSNNEVVEEMNNQGSIRSVVSIRYDMEPVYQFVKVENVKGIAFVAVDPPEDVSRRHRLRDNSDMCFKVTEVCKPATWGQVFEDKFSKDYIHPNDNDRSLDEFNETFNPW